MGDCIFCKIIKGEWKTEKIFEDEHTLAFLDINPNNRGHTLIVPKKHYRNIFDLPEEQFAAMAQTAQKLSPAIRDAMGAEGINLAMNNEAAAGQLVFHAHLHVIPRFSDDGFRHWKGAPYKDGEMMATGEAIRKAIS